MASLVAREIAAALKPNGRFGIVNWYPQPREETTVLSPAPGVRALSFACPQSSFVRRLNRLASG